MKTKRTLAWLIAAVLLLSLMAGCGGGGETSSDVSDFIIDTDSVDSDVSDLTDATDVEEDTDATTAKTKKTTKKTTKKNTVAGSQPYEMPFDKAMKFTILLAEHPSQPIDLDAVKWNMLTEMTNVTLDVDVVAQGKANEKIIASTATGQMYDITWLQYAWLRNMNSNGFLDIGPMVKTEAPNYYALVKDDPMWEQYNVYGKKLGFNMVVYDDMNTPYEFSPLAYAIREDVLDNANVAMPTTWKEWFAVMKKLKQMYPDSTPFGARSLNAITNYMVQSLTGYEYCITYNSAEKKYTCGALQPNFYAALEFMKSCYDEGIIGTNFEKSAANTFESDAKANKIFFWIDNGPSLVTLNNTFEETGFDARFVRMNLMSSHLNSNKKSGLGYGQSTNYGTMLCIAKKAKNQKEIMHFLDWCYTDEGMLVNCLGKEGETYEMDKDGNPYLPKKIWSQFADAEMPEYRWMEKYGLGQLSFAPRVLGRDGIEWKGFDTEPTKDDVAYENACKKDIAAGSYRTLLAIQPDVDSTMQSNIVTINRYINQNMVDFIKGTKNLTEFNDFLAQLDKMGIKNVLNTCNAKKNG